MQIKVGNFRARAKIAAFDYDWTLVRPHSGTFPKNVDDWRWLHECVPDVVRGYYENGFCIVIFTNQSKPWKVEQVKTVLASLGIPVMINVGIKKEEQKPERFMFDAFVGDRAWDVEDSFYVGDALGRPNDWSDVDKMFAKSVGITIKSPEDVFPMGAPNQPNAQVIPTSDSQEIVIMTGYPGSGKTTIANESFGSQGYVILQGDVLKTSAKMIKVAIPALNEGKSIVFDATNPSREKRAEYIRLKERFPGLSARCIHVSTSMEASLARNNLRDRVVPKIVFHVYKKKFETPRDEEGCTVLILGQDTILQPPGSLHRFI
jgi:bifunctional polynucleotide phosphatase/kinase